MLLDVTNIKAVIFDMDGVLFYSSDCHEEAWRDAFQSVGITDFVYASIAGMRTDEAAKKILQEQGCEATEVELEKLINRKREKALALLKARGKVSEGSKKLVQTLSSWYRLVLASSASPATVEFFLTASGYAEVFEHVLTGASVQTAKPSPEIYLMALDRLNLPPQSAIVIEDAVSGIEAAKGAGIPVIAITGTETRSRLETTGAEGIVDRLEEIMAILEK